MPQNRKRRGSSKLPTTSIPSLSEFSRINYYKAVCCLRTFAYYELPNFHTQLPKRCTPAILFDSNKNEDVLNKQLPGECWIQLLLTPWKAYTFVHTPGLGIGEVFPKLARTTLSLKHFNDDFSLSTEGIAFRDHLRQKWEHTIILNARTYKFSSSQQLFYLILDEIENAIYAATEQLTNQINKKVDDLFDSAVIDGIESSPNAMKEAFGIKSLKQDHAVTLLYKHRIFGKEQQKKIKNLLKSAHLEPTENLVSGDYLARLVGLAQAKRTS